MAIIEQEMNTTESPAINLLQQQVVMRVRMLTATYMEERVGRQGVQLYGKGVTAQLDALSEKPNIRRKVKLQMPFSFYNNKENMEQNYHHILHRITKPPRTVRILTIYLR